jgi:hypothetical protein
LRTIKLTISAIGLFSKKERIGLEGKDFVYFADLAENLSFLRLEPVI